MAKYEDEKPANTLQVRGSLTGEKIKAAKILGGDDVKFELRAMRPARVGAAGERAVACFVCIICIICIVCSLRNAEQFGLKNLPTLKE